MLRRKFNLKISISFLLITVLSIPAFAQGWDVPEAQKSKNSNVVFDAGATKEGESVFTKNCVSCHGNPGKGNFMKTLTPPPPDLAGDKTHNLTDGELFYILNTGRGVMPSFKNILSETDRWKAIAFIRSFHKGYVQVVSKTDPEKSKLVKINVSFDEKSNKVTVDVKANEKTGVVALKETEVSLFAKRRFGNLQIEKSGRTDANGVISFNFPKELPGDKEGNVELIVKISNEAYGEVESQSKMKLGIPTDVPSLTKERSMFNVMKKAPWWILITYFSGISIVIGFFIYMLLNLKKLFDLGKK
ncbi:MAG: cytochrome c [Bacteroidales bacterium]|nr:cytochrome c [Bacteroidales bacterium]